MLPFDEKELFIKAKLFADVFKFDSFNNYYHFNYVKF